MRHYSDAQDTAFAQTIENAVGVVQGQLTVTSSKELTHKIKPVPIVH